MALFLERGYAEVTVAEIAGRAGLTKRTFFNHFADKREVFFAGAKDFEARVLGHLAEAGDDLAPLDAAVLALTHGGLWRSTSPTLMPAGSSSPPPLSCKNAS